MTDNKLPSGHTRIDTLEMRKITKRFPGVLANDRVDFDVRSGEVHALLGENGAGKSTLMKVLYGMYEPSEGEILLNGKPIKITSPTDAINHGIGMIHQHFMLVETLTVAENVALGMPSSRGFLTDLDKVSKRILELADIYGLKIDPDAYIWQLSVGQQQRVEIIKALYRGAALLILDEPTAVLTPQEVDEFFGIMRQMVSDGHALIFISHKLHEIMDICDRVTVLRDGAKIGTKTIADITKSELANWMVGREVIMTRELEKIELGPSRLTLENITCDSDRGTPALRDVSLEVHSGEILGIGWHFGKWPTRTGGGSDRLARGYGRKGDPRGRGCDRFSSWSINRANAFIHSRRTHERWHDQRLHYFREFSSARAPCQPFFKKGFSHAQNHCRAQ